MGKSALAVATPAATDNIGSHERALRSAVAAFSSAEGLARALGLGTSEVNGWLDNEGECKLPYCARIEEATGIKCEALRSDVLWLRDGAGEVVGWTTPAPGADLNLVSATIRVQQGVWDRSYIDGLLYLLSVADQTAVKAMFDLDRRGADWDLESIESEVRHRMAVQTDNNRAREIALAKAEGVMICASDEIKANLREAYGLDNPVKVITEETLLGLAADVEDATSDRDYHQAYGLIYGLSDDQQKAITSKFQVFETYHATPGEFEAIEAEVARVRGNAGLDDEARSQYIMGVMHGLEDGPEIDALCDKHDTANLAAWTPEKTDALWADVQRLLADKQDGDPGEETPWIDDLMPWYSPFTGPFFGKATLERKRQAADNLIEHLNHGQVALLDYLWTAQAADKMTFDVDSRSPSDALYLSRIIAQLIQRTTDLRAQFNFALNPPEGAMAVTE